MKYRLERPTLVATSGFVGSAATAAGAYWASAAYWRPLLLNLAATFLAAGLAVVIVNLYLDRGSRKDALKALLRMVLPAIKDMHNSILDEVFKRFGKEEFDSLVKRYTDAGGDPRALTPAERDKFYGLVKDNHDRLRDLFRRLNEVMKELTAILGWSFNPDLLREVFFCRYAVSKFLLLKLDDTDQGKLDAVEQFFDSHIKGFTVYAVMKRLGG